MDPMGLFVDVFIFSFLEAWLLAKAHLAQHFEKGLVNDSLLYVVATLAVASVGKKTRGGSGKVKEGKPYRKETSKKTACFAW